MLETFKTNITPAQAMRLFTVPKGGKMAWPEHYMHLVVVSEASGGDADYLVLNNIVQFASARCFGGSGKQFEGRLSTEEEQTEELAHFAWSWELEPARHGNLGKEVVTAVGEGRKRERQRCYTCDQEEHLREACPNCGRGRNGGPDLVRAVDERSAEAGGTWILDSGSSKHLVSNEAWLKDVETCDDVCLQPNGEPLNVTKKSTLSQRVTACGEARTLSLMDVYYVVTI
ncbi:hypothetical protein PI124_g21022 [Phytophthora idaei]|nr:hypothetical protein PI125_g24983 [Phytophthora idaei]KAG3233913.1 hypothetical protein PI124_g21022 [Phytophthora idaei]